MEVEIATLVNENKKLSSSIGGKTKN